MKLSLSGVWNAYDMHTMNGQSWRAGEGGEQRRRAGPGPGAHSDLPGPSRLTPVLTRDSMMRSFRARVSPCFILMRFLSRHFMAYLVGEGGRLVSQSPRTFSAELRAASGGLQGRGMGGKSSGLLQ